MQIRSFLALDVSYCISPRVTALLSSFRAANRYSHSRAASRHSMLIPVVVAKACPDVHASMHPSLLCDWTYTVSCAEIERIFLNNKKMKKFKKGVAF